MGAKEQMSVEIPLRYGFIGLGVMGWGMANNLRTKIPASATLCVCEISDERLRKWLAQAPGPVSVVSNPMAVVEQSVSQQYCLPTSGLTGVVGRRYHYAACWTTCYFCLH